MMGGHRCEGEQGFTLIELLTVMVILSVIGGFVVTSITTALQTSTRTQARIDAIQELEVAVQRMSREIRAAAPIELIPDDPARSLQARVQRDGLIRVEAFRLATDTGPTTLVAETFPVTGDDDVAPLASRRLITLVDNGDEPLFRYFDRDGGELSAGDDLRESSWIEVTLVRDLPGQRPVEVMTTVAVRSLRYAGS